MTEAEVVIPETHDSYMTFNASIPKLSAWLPLESLVPVKSPNVILLPMAFDDPRATAQIPAPVLKQARKWPIQSASKSNTWKRCRQQYHYHYEQNLESASPAGYALVFGSFFHKGVENRFLGAKTFADVLGNEVESQKEQYSLRYEEITGLKPMKASLDEIDAIAQHAYDVLRHYFTHYSWKNPLKSHGLTYISKEQHFMIRIPGTRGYVQGYLDGIAKDEAGNLYIIDHKTYQRRPKFSDQEVNEQFMLYMWTASQIYQKPFAGVLYDGVSKDLPKPVEVLKSGKLTTDKKKLEDYTLRTYLAKIKEKELNPDDYVNEIMLLKERDAQEQTPFFSRWLVTYTPEAIDNFEREFVAVYREMASTKTPRYRNLSSFNCNGCTFRELCFAEHLGRDAEWVRKSKFRNRPPRLPS